jgi:hypothetical protein
LQIPADLIWIGHNVTVPYRSKGSRNHIKHDIDVFRPVKYRIIVFYKNVPAIPVKLNITG